MNEDLLILFEPRAHLIPEKGEVALQCGSIISRFEESAGCVLRDAMLYHPAKGVRPSCPQSAAPPGERYGRCVLPPSAGPAPRRLKRPVVRVSQSSRISFLW